MFFANEREREREKAIYICFGKNKHNQITLIQQNQIEILLSEWKLNIKPLLR